MTTEPSNLAVRIPDQAELRNLVKNDPHLIDRLRADRDRIALQASVTARVTAGDVQSRFTRSSTGLPSLAGLDPTNPKWTTAAVAHARQLLEECACLRALLDGAPSLTDARTMTAAGAAELRKTTMARIALDQAARQRDQLMAKLSSKPIHRGATR